MTGQTDPRRKIGVLIADDSGVCRTLLAAIVADTADLEVVGLARNGREAVEMTGALRPAVVLMDVHMPEMDGVEATRRIVSETPTPVVMISAQSSGIDADNSFTALDCGALAVLQKPVSPDDPHFDQTADAICRQLRLMAEVKVVRRWARVAPTPESAAVAPVAPTAAPAVVAIASSTGGPTALVDILGPTRDGAGPAVLVVQHLADGFAEGFVTWLSQRTGRRITLAEEGERVRPGTVRFAPTGAHLSVDAGRCLRLAAGAPGEVYCPAGDVLLGSVARAYGPSAMGVVLTGMGADGAAGLLEIRRAGGWTVAQSEETCVVFGMPRRALDLNAAARTLSPREIGALFARFGQG
jgi:two-component system chemotaxis response regulator CheB